VLFKVIQGSFLGNLSLGIIYVTEILFFERILHVQSNHYGFFVAIVGIGLLLGALMIQKIKGHLYDVFALGVILFGLGITLFSFTTELYLTVLLLIIEGIGEALFTIATVSLIQLNSNKDNCAGLLTINESLSKAAYLISISISGFLIDFINVQYTMLIAGIISLAYGFIYVFNCIHGINATDEATLSKGGR
jgi:predicted MFS family arabinose efflux permease